MEWTHARERFAFIGRALEASGGFAPQVAWTLNADGAYVATLSGPTELDRHQRESAPKFAARNAVAVYENHLLSAADRFVSFLGRRKPQRQGTEGPLVSLMVQDADLQGNDIDSFWRLFALDAVARGTMLLVIDKLEVEVSSLGDQQRLRAVPYIRPAYPENVVSYSIDEATSLFRAITLSCMEEVDGQMTEVERDYTGTDWVVRARDKDDPSGWRLLASGKHAFGACPVLSFTENGKPFPVIGKYSQVADLSRRIYNARSERDDILRGQTFSLLTMQIPPTAQASFDPAKAAATIGTHSMLTYAGERPDFVAPDAGPAATYAAAIAELESAIGRVTSAEATSSSGQAESGDARRRRFDSLNAQIARFALSMQSLEVRMWVLFQRGLGLANKVTSSWPTDYNLADVASELDILALMQSTGFPHEVLAAKRLSIASVEFDNSDDATKSAIESAIREQQQEEPAAAPAPST